MEKAKYGKMRQVNAVNGSQMVVKIGGVLLPSDEGDTLGNQLKKDPLYFICALIINPIPAKKPMPNAIHPAPV